jgi:hypothetical protein
LTHHEGCIWTIKMFCDNVRDQCRAAKKRVRKKNSIHEA